MEIDEWYAKFLSRNSPVKGHLDEGDSQFIRHHSLCRTSPVLKHEMHKGHNTDEMCKFLMRWPFDTLWASDAIWWQVLVNIDSGNNLLTNRWQAIT